MAIRPVKEVAHGAFKDLKKYQSGEFKPVNTGREWLDSIFGGLIPQDIVVIAGSSGAGKSFEAQRVKNFIMDEENNPDAKEYIWLDNSLEMRLLSNIIRDLNQNLEKSKKDILTKKFTREEEQLVNNYYKQLSDGRFFIDEEAVTPDEFEKVTREFLEQHRDKKAVFITLDHIALQKSGAGDKKSAIDGIVEAVNRLKKDFPNAIWIIVSQLNRKILGRIKDKDIMAIPNREDLFNSDTMYHIADYLYICHNPYRLGISQYLMVNKKQYDYLEEHWGEEDKKGNKTAFNTLGKMFYHALKIREADVIFQDIFIEDVNIPDMDKYKEEDITLEITDPDFGSSTFDGHSNLDTGDEDDVPF